MGLQICILPLSRDSDYFVKMNIFWKTFGTCNFFTPLSNIAEFCVPAHFDKFLKWGVLVWLTSPIVPVFFCNFKKVPKMGLQICILPLSWDSDYFVKMNIFCKTFGTCLFFTPLSNTAKFSIPVNFDKFLKYRGVLVKLTTPILLANWNSPVPVGQTEMLPVPIKATNQYPHQ